jgi:hypothetical protein
MRSLRRIHPAGIAVVGAVAIAVVSLTLVAGQTIVGIVGSGPTDAPRGFINGLAQRNCSQMLDNICGSFACPTIPANIPIVIKNQSYKELDNDGTIAHVQTFVDIRITSKYGEAKVELDFPAIVTKSGNKWCVKKESIAPAVESFIYSVQK